MIYPYCIELCILDGGYCVLFFKSQGPTIELLGESVKERGGVGGGGERFIIFVSH